MSSRTPSYMAASCESHSRGASPTISSRSSRPDLLHTPSSASDLFAQNTVMSNDARTSEVTRFASMIDTLITPTDLSSLAPSFEPSLSDPSKHPSWLSSGTAIKSHATAPYDGYADGYTADDDTNGSTNAIGATKRFNMPSFPDILAKRHATESFSPISSSDNMAHNMVSDSPFDEHGHVRPAHTSLSAALRAAFPTETKKMSHTRTLLSQFFNDRPPTPALPTIWQPDSWPAPDLSLPHASAQAPGAAVSLLAACPPALTVGTVVRPTPTWSRAFPSPLSSPARADSPLPPLVSTHNVMNIGNITQSGDGSSMNVASTLLDWIQSWDEPGAPPSAAPAPTSPDAAPTPASPPPAPPPAPELRPAPAPMPPVQQLAPALLPLGGTQLPSAAPAPALPPPIGQSPSPARSNSNSDTASNVTFPSPLPADGARTPSPPLDSSSPSPDADVRIEVRKSSSEQPDALASVFLELLVSQGNSREFFQAMIMHDTMNPHTIILAVHGGLVLAGMLVTFTRSAQQAHHHPAYLPPTASTFPPFLVVTALAVLPNAANTGLEYKLIQALPLAIQGSGCHYPPRVIVSCSSVAQRQTFFNYLGQPRGQYMTGWDAPLSDFLLDAIMPYFPSSASFNLRTHVLERPRHTTLVFYPMDQVSSSMRAAYANFPRFFKGPGSRKGRFLYIGFGIDDYHLNINEDRFLSIYLIDNGLILSVNTAHVDNGKLLASQLNNKNKGYVPQSKNVHFTSFPRALAFIAPARMQ